MWLSCIPLFAFAQNWDEQVLNVNLSATQYNQQLTESSSSNVLGLDTNAVKLMDGFGLAANLYLGQFSPDSNLFSSHTNYQVSFASRVFLSPNVNFDLLANTEALVKGESIANSIYRTTRSAFEKSEVDTIHAAFNFGSDQSKRALEIAYTGTSQHLFLQEPFELYSQERRHFLNSRFQNRVTEDTFIVLQYQQSDFSKQFSLTADSNLNIQQALVGIKTSYLSNSQIEVLLGSTNTDDVENELNRDRFSWNVTNQINLSDYFIWQLSLTQQIIDSNDPNFNATNSDEISSNVLYLLNDYTKLSIEFSVKNRHYGLVNNIVTTSVQKFTDVSLDYRVFEQLTLSAGVSVYDNEDTREEYVFDGFQWQLGVHWRLI